MYPTIQTFLLIIAPFLLMAQHKEGVIQYEEKLILKIDLPEEMKQYAHLIPKEKITKMALNFDENQSFYTQSKEIVAEKENPFKDGNNNTTIMTVGGGASSQIYINRKDETVLRSENVMGQQFLISGTIEKKNWKVLNEQKEILGYTCRKATMEKDSSTITAWFTTELPLTIGPGTFYGLPGTILAIHQPNEKAERTIFATKIELKAISDQITIPTKGKKVSQEAFDKLMEERLAEMRKNSEGGNGSNVIIKTKKN